MTAATSSHGHRALVAELRSAGRLTGRYAGAFEAVARERFIADQVWVQETEEGPYLPINGDREPDRWLATVYSDRPIVTQFDDGRTAWPVVGHRPSSSASMPSVVAGMLAAADVRPGHRVLEIGTGTGYNAALLAELVGSAGQVVTIDVDHELVATARRHLDSAGYPGVRVVAGDGAAGVREFAPYDRVIVTASVQVGRLPYAWVEQTVPTGLILAPMRADLASGPLVRFEVTGDGAAIGRAAPLRVGFMEIRSHRVASSASSELRWDDEAAEVTHTTLAPWVPLLADDHRWPIALAVPSCRYDVWEGTDERPHGVAWLRDPLTGSWASVVPADSDGRYVVRQAGPRRLWDEAEAAYRWWQRNGEPPIEAWVWTVEPDRQGVALSRGVSGV